VRDASQQAKVFCKLSMDSMYAFILVIYWVVEYRLLSVLSKKFSQVLCYIMSL
jgi:hypothetical protein